MLELCSISLVCWSSVFLVGYGAGMRLFPVLRYGVLINEFDPWFNFRCSEFMWVNGIRAYFDWYDAKSWVPVGRDISGTAYPVLFLLTNLLHRLINICFRVEYYSVCCLFPVVGYFFSLLLLYGICQEIFPKSRGRIKGVVSLGVFSVTGGVFEKTMAGAFDYESLSLVFVLLIFYSYLLFLKKFAKSGNLVRIFTVLWLAGTQCIFNGCWGGSIFTELVMYAYAFCTFSGWRELFCQSLITGAFGLWAPFLQNVSLVSFLKLCFFLGMEGLNDILFGRVLSRHFYFLFGSLSVLLAGLALKSQFVFQVVLGVLGKSKIYNLFLSGKSHPIVESITEHRSPSVKDAVLLCGVMVLFSPFFIFYEVWSIIAEKERRKQRIFILLGFLLSLGLFARMERFSFLVAPFLSIYVSNVFVDSIFRENFLDKKTQKLEKLVKILQKILLKGSVLLIMLVHLYFSLKTIRSKSAQVVIVLEGVSGGRRIIVDDFRESAIYMRNNFPADSVILSWWDYGYQITGMTGLSTVTDNNTNNYERISEVANILVSPEEHISRNHPFFHKILPNKETQIYIYTVCGYASKYDLIDLNKLPWISRIANATNKSLIPDSYYYKVGNRYYFTLQEIIQQNLEKDLFTNRSIYISQPLRDSLLFKLCFYNVNALISLSNLELAYESTNQIVRVFRVK